MGTSLGTALPATILKQRHGFIYLIMKFYKVSAVEGLPKAWLSLPVSLTDFHSYPL